MNIQASLECILQRPSGGTYINKTLPLLSWRIQKEGVPSNPPWWDKKWKKTNWAELSQFHSLLQLDRPPKNIAKKTALSSSCDNHFFASMYLLMLDLKRFARFRAIILLDGLFLFLLFIYPSLKDCPSSSNNFCFHPSPLLVASSISIELSSRKRCSLFVTYSPTDCQRKQVSTTLNETEEAYSNWCLIACKENLN